MTRTGVLLVAYGGPGDLDEIAPFMCSLLGCEPSEESLKVARRRYMTIGGASPLPAMSERIAVQLECALSGLPAAEVAEEGGTPGFPGRITPLPRAEDGVTIPVAAGMLHSEPSIAAAVGGLVACGVDRIVMVSLSPFEAAATTGRYRTAVAAAIAEHEGLELVEAADYRGYEKYLTMLAESLEEALGEELIRPTTPLVVFSAHSLPVEDIAADPAYVDQLRATALAVAERSGLGPADGFEALDGIEAFGGHSGSHPWLLAFQSKGRRGGEWIGPDLDDVIDAAVTAEFGSVVVSPIGFAMDHMETLYDLDVCAADRALSADIEFARAIAPNDDKRMIEVLVAAVREVL